MTQQCNNKGYYKISEIQFDYFIFRIVVHFHFGGVVPVVGMIIVENEMLFLSTTSKSHFEKSNLLEANFLFLF